MSVKRVTKFVEALAETEAAEIILYHLTPAQRTSQIGKWSDWGNTSDIVSIIWENSVAYANGLSGTQTFIIKAFAKGELDRSDPIASVAFRVSTESSSTSGEEVGSEPPTEEGVRATLMRMNHELFRNFNMMVGATTHHLASTVQRQSEQIESLVTARTMDAEAREELMSRKHDREIEMHRIEGKAKRDEQIFSSVMSYLPVAINHLAGKELVRQKDTELELVAMELATQFTMPQLDRLRDSGFLNPQQLVLMATMLEKVTKRMNTMEQVAKDAVAANNLASAPERTPAAP